MDKRKLIGTIIGVIMFAMLIVGATYAWLTFTANITNGTYNTGSRNFVITYSGGSKISKVPILSTSKTTDITSETDPSVTTDGWLRVTASKTANSPKASSFKITLHVASNELVTKSITWALCKGDCPTTVSLATVSGSGTSTTATCGTGVTACGTIAPGSNTNIDLYNDTSTFNKVEAVGDTYYNVYFWVNGETMINDDVGQEFSGYISASAIQGE